MRTLNTEGNLEILLNEISKFKIDLLGVSETHWNNTLTEAFEQDNFTIIHSCRKDGIKRQGVAIIVEKQLSKLMLSYECHNERLLSATFDTAEGPRTLFQVYAPDSSYSKNVAEEFYDLLLSKIDAIQKKKQTYIVMGDFNAKVGSDQQQVWPEAVGRCGLGACNCYSSVQ